MIAKTVSGSASEGQHRTLRKCGAISYLEQRGMLDEFLTFRTLDELKQGRFDARVALQSFIDNALESSQRKEETILYS